MLSKGVNVHCTDKVFTVDVLSPHMISHECCTVHAELDQYNKLLSTRHIPLSRRIENIHHQYSGILGHTLLLLSKNH